MEGQFDSGGSGRRARLHADFVKGLHCFDSRDYAGALMFFRTADGSAALDDIYQNRYTSFYGLSRVFTGDKNGVKLCRKAAVGEITDVEVYHNLAMAEHRLGFKEGALMALRRGLKIDPEHVGLQRIKQELVQGERCGIGPGGRHAGIIKQLLARLIGHSR